MTWLVSFGGRGSNRGSGLPLQPHILLDDDDDDDDDDVMLRLNRFSSRPEDQLTEDQLTEDQLTGDNYEGDDETSITEPISSRRKGLLQQLQQENVSLRSSLVDLQQRSEVNERRVAALSEELQQRRRQEEKEAQQRRRQEEKEAQDLESMVHSVEQNLGLMTKRAVRAESSVSKLKLELQTLQAQVDSLQKENDSLKSADSQVVMTMRQNAQMASEYLTKTLTLAHSSIRQLLGETETLHLVSQLLRSIDKMSELNTES
ncbi:endosome-associated-trafficking regulator 1 [Scomber scombrus]|uniref:Endosome-associated-trafficking regulator 1 n=1 Tax=Scomber scombrus TaxID=13677 RepID=A0AAV1QCC7_SCOSC